MRHEEREYSRDQDRRSGRFSERGRRSRDDDWQRRHSQQSDLGPWDSDEEDDDMERSQSYRDSFETDYGTEGRGSSQRGFGQSRGSFGRFSGRSRMRGGRGGQQRFGDEGYGAEYEEGQYGYDYGQPIFAGEYGEQSHRYGQRGQGNFSRGGQYGQGGGQYGQSDGQYGQGGGQFGQGGGQYGQGQYGQGDFGRGGQYGQGPFGQSGQGQRGSQQWGQRRASSGERWSGTGSWERGGNGRQGMHSGKGPKGYKRSDDRIREDLCDLLTDDPELDASNIEVKVQNCEVTLSGTVESRQLKRLAEDIAEECAGVRDVRNEIRVQEQSGGSQQTSGLSGRGETGGQSAEDDSRKRQSK